MANRRAGTTGLPGLPGLPGPRAATHGGAVTHYRLVAATIVILESIVLMYPPDNGPSKPPAILDLSLQTRYESADY
ncbi:hypothetical protein ACRE_029770 [Hapsidospora chrysogenum ATCC 11550]|uniref:Uncharacterized protein n=1 Tax=Hapsidospora chrysogenum (strain ATCC 11550 / CBS 779.69 / DSM 880 / IAM 14645 / JCM 23072 / IMI 49137) TaxID=857340 RepID=A0A086T9Y0_HAPC1|nr:hypothetical protein ACRE_029770 [Hapsidospora chrysogenum ATCC 11550]